MAGRSGRLDSIDWLRGVVMVLMALDHCCDCFGDFRVDPTAVPDTTVALFFTRWITHFCAPVFVFLAGTAAWLYGSKERTRPELSRLWRILHAGSLSDLGLIPLGDASSLTVVYPVLPWIGVMALGYAFGPWTRGESAERRRRSFRLGLALTAAFVLLRATNLYGDPDPWSSRGSAGMTVLSLLNCQKYPPPSAIS